MDNPLNDAEWVQDNFNAIYRYVTGETDRHERDQRIADQRHRELLQTHRDGWKQMATALVRAGELIADAIRRR